MIDRVRCPMCQKHIHYEPATDEPRCGNCGWQLQEPEVFKPVTIHQPWATLIISGFKREETRTHSNLKRLTGTKIGIHAGKQYDPDAWRQVNLWARSEAAIAIARPENAHLLPMGAVLGTADVVSARWLDQNELSSRNALVNCHDFRRFGLALANVKEFSEPIACIGKQGAWNWECPVDA